VNANRSGLDTPSADGGEARKDLLGSKISFHTETATASQAPVTVVVSGEPTAKGRPRATRRGFVYTPAKTRRYEAHARLAAQFAMGNRPPIEAPVRLELLVELPIPSSWSMRRRAAAVTGDIVPTSRPDVDNFLKAIFDAITNIVVVDDAQIVDVCATKKFSIAPKMVATVFPLAAVSSNRRARP
jgi:Holliday junction resolvase RusA-like endonuclease